MLAYVTIVGLWHVRSGYIRILEIVLVSQVKVRPG
jgi:hypothetical protein